jgi:hypothetical protein
MPPDGHPTLVSVPLVNPAVSRTVGLIHRRGRSLSPAAQELYDQLLASKHIWGAKTKGMKANGQGTVRVKPMPLSQSLPKSAKQ